MLRLAKIVHYFIFYFMTMAIAVELKAKTSPKSMALGVMRNFTISAEKFEVP